MSKSQKLRGRIMPHYCSFSRGKCVRFTNNEAKIKALESEVIALRAKFRLDVSIMLGNSRKLTEGRDALKEQLGKLMKFVANVENFGYIWTNHSNIPQFYMMITKRRYAIYVNAEKDVAELKRIRKPMRGRG